MDTVLITGANRGLGLELARQYAADGWQVLAASRRSSPALDELVLSAAGRVDRLPLDVTDPESITRQSRALGDRAVDVLINNAGYFGRVPFSPAGIEHQAFGRLDYADWELTLRINLLGPMRIAEAFVEHVARSRQRKLVTITSMLGSTGLNTLGGLYGYRTSKAAVNAMMKSMAIDLGRRGIVAAALHPGWARTDMGGSGADVEVADSVRGLRRVIAGLTPEQAGRVWAYDGQALPF